MSDPSDTTKHDDSDGLSPNEGAAEHSAEPGAERPAEPGADTDGRGSDLPPARAALVERLAEYESLLEIGVGHRPGVAATLADRGVDVTATDVHERDVPDRVRFVRDDVVAAADRTRAGGHPGTHYEVTAIYALNLPPELHRPARDVARAVDADFCFTTLGADQPAIPVRRETVGRATLYVATERDRS